MRLLLTADLHYNNRRSRPLADNIIDQINETPHDLLLVLGDSASYDSDTLEQCLNRFTTKTPKLFLPGNHELWTLGPDSYKLFKEELPRRIRNLGWHWLQEEPWIEKHFAIVGSLGWYDYSFAQSNLGIPERFYEAKLSPGVAQHYFEDYAHLFTPDDDITGPAREIIARWNDGRYVKLHRGDKEFLHELIIELRTQLDSVKQLQVISAIHCNPFKELLPGSHKLQWDFAKAYLGSPKLGELLLQYKNITHLFCGHSHHPAEAQIDHIKAINIGSGYRYKTFKTLDLPD